MMSICKNCDADLHLDTSDTGPGGWLGTHDPKTTHFMDQNSLCCPGTQDEHEPEMEECYQCLGDWRHGAVAECDVCNGSGEVEVER